ncbi:hypothetical protein C8Q70DRAFT_958773 [Cubamyces menziesii]|nr:hypothetical protein C8Q70DRAFT_958773 [Cubamyces menziesii]
MADSVWLLLELRYPRLDVRMGMWFTSLNPTPRELGSSDDVLDAVQPSARIRPLQSVCPPASTGVQAIRCG